MVEEEFEYKEPEPRQQELPGSEPEPVKTVIGKFMAVNYVKPIYSDDEDSKMVSMEFSLAVTKEHEPLLQDGVLYHLKVLRKGGCTLIGNIDMDPVAVQINLAPEDEPKIEMEYCEVEKVQLSVIEEKGKGKAVKVFRLSFRLSHPVTRGVSAFADEQFNKQVWLKLIEVSPKLIAEHRGEEE